jgi:polar amino acid transport system substrate-binding protein
VTGTPFAPHRPRTWRAFHPRNLLRAGFGLGLSLVLGAGVAHADATLDRIKDRGLVRVGVILSGPPFGWVDPQSRQPAGFAPDIGAEIARQLGVKAELIEVTPPNRVQFLQQGKVDLLIASMQWTEERAQILTFVPTPYDQSGGAAVARKGAGLTRWEDLKGKPVCLSQGSNFAKPLVETYGAQVKGYPGMPESLLALRGGNCVAAVHVGAGINLLVRNDAEWKDYEVPFADELIPSNSVIWVRRGETDTQAAVDKIVRHLHGSGWILAEAQKTQLVVSPALLAWHDQFKGEQ